MVNSEWTFLLCVDNHESTDPKNWYLEGRRKVKSQDLYQLDEKHGFLSINYLMRWFQIFDTDPFDVMMRGGYLEGRTPRTGRVEKCIEQELTAQRPSSLAGDNE